MVLKTKKFTDRELSKDIFRRTWSEEQSELIFKKQLYASFKTLERIKVGVTTNVINGFKLEKDNASINNFSDFLFVFCFDVFELVEYAESKYNNNKVNFQMGSRSDLSVQEIFENASIICT